MAKKRRVKRDNAPVNVAASPAASDFAVRGVQPLSIAAAMLGAACVYVSYHPSDSVAVEAGDALWFGVIALLLGTITWAASFWSRPAAAEMHRGHRISVIIDVVPWLLAAWMMLAAWATSPPGNLREATNEAWFWVSGAAIFTASRRLLSKLDSQRCVLALLIVCSFGLALHGLHQQFISLPQDRVRYRADPEQTLRDLGFDAPAGSAERMMFENRLLDGGPTGTFALANSLAAVLLLGVIASIGVMRLRWTSLDGAQRIFCGTVLIICLAGLLAARSRSSALAAMIAIGLLFVIAALTARDSQSESQTKSPTKSQSGATKRKVMVGLVGVFAAGAATAIGLAVFGNPEWFEQAPASVAVRLQYWRSTWAMTMDRPLFGAGPGNFKTIYLRYRESSANEQIADPHNFLFETLSAGGGVALVLLALLIVAIVLYRVRGLQSTASEAQETSRGWVWLGAGAALVLVWLIGVAAGRTPDFQAHVFVVPITIAAAWMLWSIIRALNQNDVDLIAAISLIGLLIHLLTASGWTIPGVAIHVWLLAGLLTRTSAGVVGPSSRGWSVAALVCGLLLLGALRWMSLSPSQNTHIALAKAEYSHRQGLMGQTMAALDQAIEADPWSVDASVWKADLLRWQLVHGQADSTELRRQWRKFVAMANDRAGEDPTILEVIGRQTLHLYQRFGKKEDLEAAERAFSGVVRWNPADLNATAQLATIVDRLGDQKGAAKLAGRAHYLSTLGNNIERALERQLIFVAEPLPAAARNGPIRRPANELLANHLPSANVSAGSN